MIAGDEQLLTGLSELSKGDLARIEASGKWRRDRVEVLNGASGPVVVKGHRPKRGPWRFWTLDALAWLTRVPALGSIYVPGGAEGQALEIRRLQELRAVGIPVPRVLHVAENFFVMSWLGGEQLANILCRRHPAALHLWQEAGDLLLRVHRADQCLSQCFGRNIIVQLEGHQPRVSGFIDFEDDPLRTMSLPDAQVHDWLIFLHSTVWMVPADNARIDRSLDGWMGAESALVRQSFENAVRRLVWLRRLPRSERLGRDVRSLRVVAFAALRWLKRNAEA